MAHIQINTTLYNLNTQEATMRSQKSTSNFLGLTLLMLLIAIIFMIFSGFAYAQEMNPDGYIGGVSLHITPYYSSGEADLTIENINVGTVDYTGSFNLGIGLAIPVNPKFSIKLFYDYNKTGHKFNSNFIDLLEDESDGVIHNFGGTLSFYFGGR